MATSYESIYQRAIFRFRDYDFMKMNDLDVGEVLKSYMRSAIADFEPVCLENLADRDDENDTFNVDLSDGVQEIIAAGIAYYWLSFKTLDSKALQNVLNSKDYYYYSPAMLLKEVKGLRDEVRSEFYSKMRRYSYNDNDLETLKP